jgi:hypothetical protein
MCLMTMREPGMVIPELYLQNAASQNSDGWGVMFARDGRVEITKAKAGFSAFKRAWAKVPEDAPAAAHFRFATSGAKNDKLCHPFKILKARENGVDLAMMHNGVMSDFNNPLDSRSDSLAFIEDFLQPALAGNPALIESKPWRDSLGILIGSGNKLLFLDGAGRHYIINEGDGVRKEGVWYSNSYSLTKSFDYEDWRSCFSKEEIAKYNTRESLNKDAEGYLIEDNSKDNPKEEPELGLTIAMLDSMTEEDVFDLVCDSPEDVAEFLISHGHWERRQ